MPADLGLIRRRDQSLPDLSEAKPILLHHPPNHLELGHARLGVTAVTSRRLLDVEKVGELFFVEPERRDRDPGLPVDIRDREARARHGRQKIGFSATWLNRHWYV